MKTKILEYIDFEKVNTLLEGFNQSTGFVTAILDLDGNVLSKSGWRQICTEFHRINPETSKKCTISDTVLAGQLGKGEKYHFYKCLNGLVDVAVPIIIKGEHIANLFSGQFLFEKPDNSFFQNQAAKFGFNESVYLKALGDVPVIPEEKVKVIMEFLLNMTQLISDMTMQKLELIELNATLQESEERFRLMIKNSNDAFVLINEKGEQFYISDAAVRDTGYTVDELKGPIQNVVHPDDWEIVNQAWSEVLTKKAEPVRVHYRHKHRYKEYIWYEAVAQNFIDNPAINAVVVNVRDITAIKETELELIKAKQKAEEGGIELKIKNNELNEKNEFIQTILDNLPIGLSLNKFDEGQATYMNKKFEEIYGWNANEVNSVASFFELVYPDEEYRKSLVNRIMADINSGDSEKMHWENIQVTRKDGSIRIVNAVNIPLIEQNTMVSTVMDVTELYQIQNDLQIAKENAEESDHLKTAFLHNISHEIRTPMNSIIGFSDLLNQPDLHPEKRQIFTDTIIKSSDQLLSIITDIISIATLEAGQEKVFEKEVDINSTLRSLHEQFMIKADEQNVNISLKQPLANEFMARTDETKLIQVLTNLINNALKFTVKGSVIFGYNQKGEELEFFIEDTGIGISPELYQVIFDRFRQVEGIAQQFGGSGLGLSISKGYVELMGGRMWLKSELGKGTTFYFTIPFKKVHKTTPSETQFVDELTIKNDEFKTILIAEDEDSNFMLIQELLSGLHANIIRAVNGIEAVNICKLNKNIDLILMDIKMPQMNGDKAAKQIKAFAPELPIIAQTAYSTEAEKKKILASGCNDFISKPLKKELLLAKIKKQIERA